MAELTFRCGYLGEAETSRGLERLVDRIGNDLRDVDFDTLVATGVSGTIIVPALALSLGKKFVIVRKEHDDSHHGAARLVGQMGHRWIFVDDLISSGKTRRYVLNRVKDAVCTWDPSFVTTHVGTYRYADYSHPGFEPANLYIDEEF